MQFLKDSENIREAVKLDYKIVNKNMWSSKHAVMSITSYYIVMLNI